MRNNRPKNSVVQLDMNGCFLNWYESMLDAEKKTGVRNSGISACCSGRYSQSGGYKWMLEKDFIGG